MTSNEIMVLAWPVIGVVSVGLFGWWMLGWIDRKHLRKATVKNGKAVAKANVSDAVLTAVARSLSRAGFETKPEPVAASEVRLRHPPTPQEVEILTPQEVRNLAARMAESERRTDALIVALDATRQAVETAERERAVREEAERQAAERSAASR